MIIDAVTVRTDVSPWRVHMMVSEGINLSADPYCELSDSRWRTYYFNQNAITFDSDVHRWQVESAYLNRNKYTLLYLYKDMPAFDMLYTYMRQYADTKIGDGSLAPYEGRYNAYNVYGMPVYPVTVFTPDQREIGRDLFMPVPYINDALAKADIKYRLYVNEEVCMFGDIVYKIRPYFG